MRLFTGIDLPAEVKGNLAAVVDRLRATARVKWSTVDQLHVTTKFIGEWPESRLAELTGILRGLPGRPPIPISIGGLGWFPNARAPRVFWAGVEAPAALAELARQTDAALAELGIAPEKRSYSPHLTLARINDHAQLDGLRRALSTLPAQEFGTFTADRFHLYLSQRGPSGSVYTKLEECSFTGS
jgi:2'-5' RNA ligase